MPVVPSAAVKTTHLGSLDDPGLAAPGSTERSLDWLNLFVANIQTGFGPFIAVYLTTQGWTQTAIGFALSLGTITAMASQMPAGALVDAMARKRRVAAFSIISFAASALLFAVRPQPLWVYLAEVLHGASSCTLSPAVAAMSLAAAGSAGLGLRLGRNARYASIGSGLGAALMGACGYWVSDRAVFLLTAVLCLPALACLRGLSRLDGPACRADRPAAQEASPWPLLRDPRLLVFAACATLFTLANAAMLPLAGTALTKQAGDGATLFIAAGMVLPQLMVALLSPRVGQLAETRGRRLVMIVGFAMLPLKGLLFATMTSPVLVVLIQGLDGIAGACFGVLMPLVTSDVAGRSRHFTLALGVVGFAIGIGATIGTSLAGYVADLFGDAAAFATLGSVGLAATLLVWAAMPETRGGEVKRALLTAARRPTAQSAPYLGDAGAVPLRYEPFGVEAVVPNDPALEAADFEMLEAEARSGVATCF